MQSFDALKLQRLVDGELERAETRELLKLAEENPLLWRDMASAFVENQIWQSEFGRDALDNPVGLKRREESNNGNSTKAFPFWLSMAAGMMVALTAGWIIGQGGVFSGSDNTIAATNQPSNQGLVTADQTPSIDTPERTLVSYPDYHLSLEDQNGNRYLDSEIPLYNISNANRAGIRFDQPTDIPSDFLERVQRTGYGVNENIQFISGQLNDGRQFYVPVRTINLSPGQ